MVPTLRRFNGRTDECSVRDQPRQVVTSSSVGDDDLGSRSTCANNAVLSEGSILIWGRVDNGKAGLGGGKKNGSLRRKMNKQAVGRDKEQRAASKKPKKGPNPIKEDRSNSRPRGSKSTRADRVDDAFFSMLEAHLTGASRCGGKVGEKPKIKEGR